MGSRENHRTAALLFSNAHMIKFDKEKEYNTSGGFLLLTKEKEKCKGKYFTNG